MNLTNNILLEKKLNIDNEISLRYIEFPALTNSGVSNLYTLKELDFSKSDLNINRDRNYKIISNLLNIPREKLIYVTQTHSNNILVIENDEDLEKDRENYDGIITNRSDIAIVTNNADCILFVVYDKKKKILGNIHSGWSGTLKRILENTIDTFINRFKSDINDIDVYVSPSIRNCCFEVSEDVKSLFEDEFSEIESTLYIKEKVNEKNELKYLIDTVFLNKFMIKSFGIKETQIYDSNICSLCSSDKVHSFRGSESSKKNERAIMVVKMNSN